VYSWVGILFKLFVKEITMESYAARGKNTSISSPKPELREVWKMGHGRAQTRADK
jgi:hypothetical protein